MKKLTALLLALVMVLAMNATAFAADTGAVAQTNNVITFVKEIEVFNDDTSLDKVYGPGITYTYSIAPDPAGTTEGEIITDTTITDKDGTSVTVKKGIAAGVTFTDDTAVFTENAVVALTSGEGKISDELKITIDPSKFTAAGVYRYVITEADNTAAMTTNGLTRGEKYVSTRYLDVYMKNGTSGPEVMGYVMFVVDPDGTGSSKTLDAKEPTNTTADGKTTGFVETYDPTVNGEADSSGNGLGDKYYTFNYTVTKTITGDLADKTHPFPFVLATSTAVTDHQFTATSTGTNTSGIGSGDIAKIGTAISSSLADSQTITLKGLPANTKVTVTETNDTTDTYKVTIADATKGSIKAETDTAAGATQTTGEQQITNYTDFDTDPTKATALMTATTFTNKLDDVSLTGVTLRFAPYAIMLGAGVALFIILKVRKNKAVKEA